MKLLKEKFVQDKIIEYLSRKGWSRNLKSKSQDEHGVDIRVRHNNYARYWLIECKGDASKTAKSPRSHREVCFNLALGQIITRMKTGAKRTYKWGCKYGVGFPSSFEDLVVRRLPYNIAHQLNLYIFLVDDKGKVCLYDWKKLKQLQK